MSEYASLFLWGCSYRKSELLAWTVSILLRINLRQWKHDGLGKAFHLWHSIFAMLRRHKGGDGRDGIVNEIPTAQVNLQQEVGYYYFPANYSSEVDALWRAFRHLQLYKLLLLAEHIDGWTRRSDACIKQSYWKPQYLLNTSQNMGWRSSEAEI